MYEKGFLPNGTGWMNQPNKFIEVMAFIDSELSKHQREMEQKNGRK
jgi:hypothetical protein